MKRLTLLLVVAFFGITSYFIASSSETDPVILLTSSISTERLELEELEEQWEEEYDECRTCEFGIQ